MIMKLDAKSIQKSTKVLAPISNTTIG